MTIGLKHGTVELAPHDPDGERLAAETIEKLWSIFGSVATDIQHVGSTAVRGIKAKPIIDIAVAVDNFQRLKSILRRCKPRAFCGANGKLAIGCCMRLGIIQIRTAW